MLLTPHILSGMVFGSFSTNPAISVFLGILSYLVLEMIPHWDPENRDRKLVTAIRVGDFWVALITFLISIAYLGSDKALLPYILGGVFAGLSYLFFSVLHLFPNQNQILKTLHKYRINLKYTDRSSWGIVIQAALCILALAIMHNWIDFPTLEKISQQFSFKY